MSLSNSKFPIGLDISDYSLKVVQLGKKRKKTRIQSFNKIGLEKGILNDGVIALEDRFMERLKKLLEKPRFGQITSREVVACLPESKTYIKLIKVEKGPNNLSDIIESEIEKHIPVSIKDIYYDWQKVGEDKKGYSILIGAAPRDIVDQYIEVLGKANLSVVALEIESMAICRSLLKQESPNFKGESNKNYCLIDIGAKRTSLVIYARNTIVTAISMSVSGQEATDKISHTLEINHGQAEKAKIICGLDKEKAEGIIYDILSEMINRLFSRIENAFDFYDNHYVHLGSVNQIILCGGGSGIKDLDKIIKQKFSIDTIIGDFSNVLGETKEKLAKNFMENHKLDIKLSKNKKDTSTYNTKQNSLLSYTTAIGLALRGIYIKK